jgi:NADH dehydrogenase FAD-containing subunit
VAVEQTHALPGRRRIVGYGPRRPARVLVAGSGVGALETILALHDDLGRDADLTLIAPDASFAYRPLAVAAPFGAAVPRVQLDDVLRWRGVRRVPTRLAYVEPERRRIVAEDGEHLGYDFLVVATGAARRRARPGALTIGDAGDTKRIREAIVNLASRGRGALAFMVPGRTAWALPVYEAALMAATRADQAGSDAQMTIVTPERAPLEILGDRASKVVEALLRERGIAFRGSTFPFAVDDEELLAVPGRPVPADAVISAPELAHQPPVGLPGEGRVPSDEFGRVDARDDIYVVGEASDRHVGHGGVAAEQADAAASAIAALIDAGRVADPFRPVIRAVLMTGSEPLYVRTEPGSGRPDAVSRRPLWWPPVKIAGRHLGPALDGHGVGRVGRA